jgi:hypothetical protein
MMYEIIFEEGVCGTRKAEKHWYRAIINPFN